jgi:hypothetical protein
MKMATLVVPDHSCPVAALVLPRHRGHVRYTFIIYEPEPAPAEDHFKFRAGERDESMIGNRHTMGVLAGITVATVCCVTLSAQR